MVNYYLSVLARFNWHVHSNLSACGSAEMTVSNALAFAQDLNLEGIAFVDHHHSREYDILRDLTRLRGELRTFILMYKITSGKITSL